MVCSGLSVPVFTVITEIMVFEQMANTEGSDLQADLCLHCFYMLWGHMVYAKNKSADRMYNSTVFRSGLHFSPVDSFLLAYNKGQDPAAGMLTPITGSSLLITYTEEPFLWDLAHVVIDTSAW